MTRKPQLLVATWTMVLASMGLGTLAGPAWADDQSAVGPTHLKLPQGPGSLEGLGENVEPNLSMGLMSYGVPIAVPNGYPGLAPSLRIAYSSGSSSSVVGMGWSFAPPSIERMTSQGLPHYTTEDRFAANGSDELVRVDERANVYRARFESGFVRYSWVDEAGDGRGGFWIADYPDGRVGYFGAGADGVQVPEARLAGEAGVFRYQLVEMEDPLGHRARYEYLKVDGTPLLHRVGYVWHEDDPRYELALGYENRPDHISDGKPGFETVLTQRLHEILVRSRGEQLRRYELEYEEHAGLSRLARVTTYGRDDAEGAYPVVFRFGYTGGAEQSCGLGTCARPEVHVIEGGSGVNFATGAADLIDLNGDSLPDIVDTSTERHTIYLNEPRTSGGGTVQELVVAEPSVGGSLDLRAGNVTMLDLDGNGFADMVDAASQRVLFNEGTGDWLPEETVDSLSIPNFAEDANARSVDVDNDGCIDVLHCDQDSSWYWQSDCAGGFTVVEAGVAGVGAGFADGGLQLADMNGDGLQDLVRVAPDLVVYWLSFGHGRWSERREMASVPAGVELGYQLVDLSGDGLADLVRVAGNEVIFALNRNGNEFAKPESLVGTTVLPIPELGGETSLRFADMNGSGSTDVVWIDGSGQVTYLELFPERPNLLSNITNGLGKETLIEYGSTTTHMARDGGPEAWRHRLPHPMLTVDRIRTRDARSGVEQVQSFSYRNGYYDRVEKQFRGFETVEVITSGDETSETRRDLYAFNVGFDDEGEPDPYFKGLLLEQTVSSGTPEHTLETTTSEYHPCELSEVPEVEPAVRFICQAGTTRVIEEGRPEAEWVTLAEQYEYDGYGNRTLTENRGVIRRGGGGCAACGTEGGFGEPCGPQCLGDEAFERTEFISPDHTNGRWILQKPAWKQQYGALGSPGYALERYIYDGLPSGELDVGLLTQTLSRINTDDEFVPTARTTYDDHGAPIAVMDANDHARRIDYDADSLLVVAETVQLDDGELRMEVEYVLMAELTSQAPPNLTSHDLGPSPALPP